VAGVFSSRLARRRAVGYVAALAISLVLLALSSNPLVRELQQGVGFAFKPFLSTIDGVAHDVGSILGAIGEIDRLRIDNEQLRTENERLTIENRRAEEIKRENELLTGLLQLRNGFDYETIAASIIGRESSELRRVVVIDRGSDDGLQVGNVVVASGGALTGRVLEVGKDSSRILLINDTSSTAIGQLGSSAATGEVVGQVGGSLVMKNVDSTVQVSIGEEVFTAGISLAGGIRSPYPKGLLIGRVVDVQRNPLEIVQTVYLEPAASLDRLEFVLVILDYRGGLPNASDGPIPCGPTASGTLPDSDQPCATAAPSPAPSGR
jgi:rod shape-determining protein MreC